MNITDNRVLRVPGATHFYRVRGTGPVLLILAGGHGDADTTDALCEKLIDRDDVHQLLAALTTEPSLVFGSSIGALIGLGAVANPAFQEFVVLAAVDYADREPDVGSQQPTPQATANLNFFFTHDVPSC